MNEFTCVGCSRPVEEPGQACSYCLKSLSLQAKHEARQRVYQEKIGLVFVSLTVFAYVLALLFGPSWKILLLPVFIAFCFGLEWVFQTVLDKFRP